MERNPGSHKGENGKVGVIGGSIDYTGAPALSAMAALRTGSDLVKILTSESARQVVAGYSENLIVEGYRGKYFGENSLEKAEKLAEWADVLVIGPGMGELDREVLGNFMEDTDLPKVVDADAIVPGIMHNVSNAVFTPHSSEAERIEEEFGSIEEFVNIREAVVLKKEREDAVFTSEKVEEFSRGHQGMTVGGTGDVLTGVVASLISQDLEMREAAEKAAIINGKAGEKAAEKYGNGLLATDVIEKIPAAVTETL